MQKTWKKDMRGDEKTVMLLGYTISKEVKQPDDSGKMCYIKLPTSAISDKNISPSSLRVLATALMMPEDYLIQESWLSKETGLSRPTIRKAIDELQAAGYWLKFSVILDGVQTRSEHCVSATPFGKVDRVVTKRIDGDTQTIHYVRADGTKASMKKKLTQKEWIEYEKIRSERRKEEEKKNDNRKTQ